MEEGKGFLLLVRRSIRMGGCPRGGVLKGRTSESGPNQMWMQGCQMPYRSEIDPIWIRYQSAFHPISIRIRFRSGIRFDLVWIRFGSDLDPISIRLRSDFDLISTPDRFSIRCRSVFDPHSMWFWLRGIRFRRAGGPC